MKLIVGLGNPGAEYARTRHNLGFMVIDECARTLKAGWGRTRFHGEIAEVILDGEKCLFLKPQTYMNLSGSSLAEAAAFFKLDWNDVLVVHDDLDLAFGRLKIKIGGADGGHRGIRSILQHAPNDFVRARLGIGRPRPGQDAAAYVLEGFAQPEAALLEEFVSAGAKAVQLWLTRGTIQASNRYNGKALVSLAPPPAEAEKTESEKPAL